MSAELKTCPFCGGSAQGWRDVSRPEQKEAGYGSLQYGVKCASDLVCEAEIVGFATREEADAAWNTRAPQWLPIESAPRDGSWIVIGRAGHGAVLLAFWHRLHGAWWGQGGDDGQWKKWQQATHWQPLPAPPEVNS